MRQVFAIPAALKKRARGLYLCGPLAVAAALTGCGSAPGPGVLEPTMLSAVGSTQVRVLAVTNRKFEEDKGVFGAVRTLKVSYQAIGVSVPPAHAVGEIEWPDGASGDPAKVFVTTSRSDLDETRFRAQLRREMGASGEVLVFVHGFNTNYQEGVFRMAQIAADSGVDGAHVLFSWPSIGEVTGYIRDRESANFSRDQLERLMRFIAATPGVRKVNLLAHSMGNWLAVEMLRQAKIKGDMEFGGKLGQVLLASPDIDAQVFQTQAEVIGPRTPPIVVFVSRNDKALSLSSKLAGDIPRVGSVALDDPRVKAAIQRTVCRLSISATSKAPIRSTMARLPPPLRLFSAWGAN